MLTSIRLKNYRAYQDTKKVPLTKLNILLGANNAGKTSFMSAIELMLRSLRGGGTRGPLLFSEMASFASFDAMLRKHWGPGAQRPKALELHYAFSEESDAEPLNVGFVCRENVGDNSAKITQVIYEIGKYKASLLIDEADMDRVSYTLQGPKGGKSKAQELFFHGVIPFANEKEGGQFRDLAMRLFATKAVGRPYDLEVIHPSRPVPRSFYVVDDPGLTAEDRALLTYLIRLWGSKDESDEKVRARIVANMSALGLTKNFAVSPISRRTGPKVFEIRVSPTSKRQTVTIADAGFGVSQVLPLIVYEARLNKGYLVAYQPELHLHPRAQARLADIFVGSVARGNQVFVETHSPDLILRLQLLVVEGRLKPEDVSVFCFENTSGKADITAITFDKAGIPSATWPGGFLDTSLGLARELNSARLAQAHQTKK